MQILERFGLSVLPDNDRLFKSSLNIVIATEIATHVIILSGASEWEYVIIQCLFEANKKNGMTYAPDLNKTSNQAEERGSSVLSIEKCTQNLEY